MPASLTDAALILGNAPTMMSLEDLQRVAPLWMNTSHAIFDDEEAHKVRFLCT